MNAQWKPAPGDVALVQNEWNVWNVAVLVVGNPSYWQYGVAQSTSPLGTPARRLVVIDPEDTEQVERLRRLILGPLATAHGLEDFADCLREFASPKPEEPTGLGAVVEDADGSRWVRTNQPYPWAQNPGPDDSGDECWESGYYADISAVRVLSEGVTA